MIAGSIVMGTSLYLNSALSKRYKMYMLKLMAAKDKRSKIISEVFSNIRYIKTAGLENYFLKKIIEIKHEELKWIAANLNRGCLSITLNNGIPILFLATIFSTYMYIHGALDIPTIFTVMQVYTIFTWNFRTLPYILIFIFDLIVAGQRICFFLLSEEINTSYIQYIPKEDKSNETAIEVKNGNFYWEDKVIKQLYKDEKERIA